MAFARRPARPVEGLGNRIADSFHNRKAQFSPLPSGLSRLTALGQDATTTAVPYPSPTENPSVWRRVQWVLLMDQLEEAHEHLGKLIAEMTANRLIPATRRNS